MAEDTREPTTTPGAEAIPHQVPAHIPPAALPPGQTTPSLPRRPIAPSSTAPTQPVNIMPGGTHHTAGGRTPDVTFTSVLSTLSISDLFTIHHRPCVRDALLVGIGTGFTFFASRLVVKGWRGQTWKAANWAVGSFAAGSFGMYQYCLYQRRSEKEGVKRAVEVMERKRVEKERELEGKRVERRRAREEAERVAEEARRREEEEEKSRKKGWLW